MEELSKIEWQILSLLQVKELRKSLISTGVNSMPGVLLSISGRITTHVLIILVVLG